MALPVPGGKSSYRGRFAPSPSGVLHDGSLLTAMASFLDARAHKGQWLLRIEDIDTPRVVPGADRIIMQQLQALGMQWDESPVWQSQRHALYQATFNRLAEQNLLYGCACTRQELSWGPYQGTCRNGLPAGRQARAWRFKAAPGTEYFHDRWHGPQQQDVATEVGDFIVKRADGVWAYQLVVVIDDGDQGITDIVRGADLLDSTARQQMLARSLGIDYPSTMHIPLLLDQAGRKLSKQNHAVALDLAHAMPTLNKAWQALGFLALPETSPYAFWQTAQEQWARRFNIRCLA
ncbi:tRNA glutamyl-Q(34) synthetase GluQRS [Alcaligenaceae bacterium]|nr:tRNA glutamyl-Q(34) synthetase GluQRS [Alcaligenaceae bacterium]